LFDEPLVSEEISSAVILTSSSASVMFAFPVQTPSTNPADTVMFRLPVVSLKCNGPAYPVSVAPEPFTAFTVNWNGCPATWRLEIFPMTKRSRAIEDEGLIEICDLSDLEPTETVRSSVTLLDTEEPAVKFALLPKVEIEP
jgi:hypothetical protein